ncbi:bidirectional sugar transporter SWEET5 [Cajanus cajan]|uniref:bidirectional sugar transporter SWEET5 n=1 Tax=Cajanus cajan TaxID=3821 RepID=UPI0010FB05BD|nr:bidirectional sugar transporter SWEET5 [Cajanus cajan]
MVNTGAIRTALGVVGNIISFGLFMSPVPTFVSIWKAKSVQDFKPDPYIATLLNCAVWSFYGMPYVSEDNILVLTINAFGLCLELFYILMFLIYSTREQRKKIMLVVLGEIIFVALLVTLLMTLVHTPKKRKLIVGPICIVFNIIMYASPLTVMRLVIQTKSVKYMPFLLSFTNFANGIAWTVYAILKWDPFVVIPNSLGTLSGLLQLSLYAIYYRTTNWNEETPNIV